MLTIGGNLTLTEALAQLGYTHRPRSFNARAIVRVSDGADVFVGNCFETWEWLDRTGQTTSVPGRKGAAYRSIVRDVRKYTEAA